MQVGARILLIAQPDLDREFFNTTGLCVVTQFADTPTYVRTIHHLSMYPPSVLLYPGNPTEGWKNSNSFGGPWLNKRRKVSREGEGESNDAADASSRSHVSILIRCVENLFDIQARPFPRRHWNYQEGKHASSARMRLSVAHAAKHIHSKNRSAEHSLKVLLSRFPCL